MTFIQLTYAWLQTITTAILALIFISAFFFGMRLRYQVRRDTITPLTAITIIDSITTAVALFFGPVILFVMLAIMWPSFARWVVSNFLPNTTIWQSQFQLWLDRQITDDFAATAAGSVIKSVQLGFAVLFPILGVVFRFILKFIMSRRHFKRLLRDQLAQGSKRRGPT